MTYEHRLRTKSSANIGIDHHISQIYKLAPQMKKKHMVCNTNAMPASSAVFLLPAFGAL